ncbi:MAG: cobyric acid synthase CobQ, partial [Acidaminococcaceae bacterium]
TTCEGAQSVQGKLNVYGTYVHGVFDGDGIAQSLVEALLAKKGLKMTDLAPISFAEYKKQQYDLLAEQVRTYLDMEKIKSILEAGV